MYANRQLGVAHSGTQLHTVIPLEAEKQTMNILPPKRRPRRRKQEFESSQRWSLVSIPNQCIYSHILRLLNSKKSFKISLVTNKSQSQSICTSFSESLSGLLRVEIFGRRLQNTTILNWSTSQISSCKCWKCLQTRWRNAWKIPYSIPGHTCAPNDSMWWPTFWKSQVSWRPPSMIVRKSCSRFHQRVMAFQDCVIELW